MVRFVSSAQQNQEMLAKCRNQYLSLLEEQNAQNDQNDHYEDHGVCQRGQVIFPPWGPMH